MKTLVFDIGGSKTRTAIMEDGKFLAEPQVISTPDSFEELLGVFESAIAGENIERIAGGIAGVVKSGVLVRAVNLPQFEKVFTVKALKEHFDVSVMFDNDAACAGLGEATVGAATTESIVAYITSGTGVGGARIVEKKLDERVSGFEPGHQIIDFDTSACTWVDTLSHQKPNHLDAFIAGRAVHQRFGKSPRDITDEDIWNELARVAAVGLYNVVMFWNPDTIVLGGSMFAGKPAIPLAVIETELQKLLGDFMSAPKITLANLGDFGTLYGAERL